MSSDSFVLLPIGEASRLEFNWSFGRLAVSMTKNVTSVHLLAA